MPRRTKYELKYKLPGSSKSGGHPFYWLLIFVVGAFIGWLWWKSGHPSTKTIPSATVAAVTKTNAPTSRRSNPPELRRGNGTSPVSPGPTTNQFPRPVQNILEAQIALISDGISPGSLDGAPGGQTRAALIAFQWQEGLRATGMLDEATKNKLALYDTPFTTYTVTAEDVARLQRIAPTWLGKSQQTALDFENILELVSEKTFAHPNLIRRINPAINWSNVVAGTVIQVPNAAYPEDVSKAAWVTIHLASKTLEAYDADTNLIAHFPCSIAKNVEKRPVGLLHVVVVAPHPNYTFDPNVFPESPEAHQLNRKLVLPPGPNNPVGVAWIGLDRPGYGIHGTPRPEDVGRTESHGCFRLANWNAEYLLRLINIGTPVYVVE